jgi:hypothetical protein
MIPKPALGLVLTAPEDNITVFLQQVKHSNTCPAWSASTAANHTHQTAQPTAAGNKPEPNTTRPPPTANTNPSNRSTHTHQTAQHRPKHPTRHTKLGSSHHLKSGRSSIQRAGGLPSLQIPTTHKIVNTEIRHATHNRSCQVTLLSCSNSQYEYELFANIVQDISSPSLYKTLGTYNRISGVHELPISIRLSSIDLQSPCGVLSLDR